MPRPNIVVSLETVDNTVEKTVHSIEAAQSWLSDHLMQFECPSVIVHLHEINDEMLATGEPWTVALDMFGGVPVRALWIEQR